VLRGKFVTVGGIFSSLFPVARAKKQVKKLIACPGLHLRPSALISALDIE